MTALLQSILAGLGGMFGWGIYDFFGGFFSKQIGNFKTIFWSQLAGLGFAALLLFVFAINLQIPALILALLPIASIFYAAAYLLFFKGFELGKISIISAIMNLWAVFTMLFAFIFLGQQLSPTQSLGVLMIVVGVTLVSLNLGDIQGKNVRIFSGVKETVLAAFLFGIFWNLSEIISENIGWLSTTLFIKLGVVVFLLCYSLFLKRQLSLAATPTRTKWAVVLAGIIEAGAVISVNWGLTIGDVILVTPISSALSIVTILMAIVILKEKITRQQGIGIVTAIAGIVLTAF